MFIPQCMPKKIASNSVWDVRRWKRNFSQHKIIWSLWIVERILSANSSGSTEVYIFTQQNKLRSGIHPIDPLLEQLFLVVASCSDFNNLADMFSVYSIVNKSMNCMNVGSTHFIAFLHSENIIITQNVLASNVVF